MPSFRKIAKLDLASFPAPSIRGNRGLFWQVSWYLTNALFFQGAILGLIPSRAKAGILRFFGATVGEGLVCKPRVSIKHPWFLQIGDHVWLGEQVWIDNHTTVAIGSNVCISQGAYLFTGNHDWHDPTFSFFSKEIHISDGVWITAFQRVPPGAVIEPHVALVGADRKGSYRESVHP